MLGETKREEGISWPIFGWIFLLALAVRALALIRTDPVAFDSAIYFEMAQQIRAGDWRAALVFPFPPLFPVLIAGFQWLGSSQETAGLIIALATDLLVLLPLAAISLAAAGPGAAWGAAFLWAIHPYAVRLGVQALTDAPSALFIAVAIWAGLRGLSPQPATQNPHPSVGVAGTLAWPAAAGAASGLAYLFRPEGIEPVLVLAALCAVESRKDKGQSPPSGSLQPQATGPLSPPAPARRAWLRAGWAVALLAGWAIVAGPYVAYLSVEAGSFTISKKKSPAAMLRSITAPVRGSSPEAPGGGRGPGAGGQGQRDSAPAGAAKSGPPPPGVAAMAADSEGGQAPGGPLAGSLYVFRRPLLNGLHPAVIVLGVLGAVGLRRYGPSGRAAHRLLGALLVVHGLVLVGLAAASGPRYLGGHHLFAMVLYALPFAGAGLAAAVAWVGDRFRAPRLIVIPVLAALVAITLPQSVFRGPDRGTALRAAAEWIRTQVPSGVVIVTDLAKLTYHAEAARVDLHGSYDEILRRGRAQGAQFVAFYPDKVAQRSPDFLNKLNPADLELARAFPEPARGDPTRRVEVYRLKTK